MNYKLVNAKNILTRRAIEWDRFLDSIIESREEKNMEVKLKKPELERLILHNFLITKLKEDLINLEITEREKQWMLG